ncbi:MAG TPA: DUF2182 domain-containing protein [Humisphaera sp.]|nr:DUF2182 domain-containing protein [Humisphaera sp.]
MIHDCEPSATLAPPPAADRGERVVYFCALIVFVISAALTVYLCRSMGDGMEMAGGWTMSMMWMTMPGQTQVAAAGMFLLMWLAMMVAMMLPSAMPTIVVYRRLALFRREPRAKVATLALACGYFFVWICFGAAAYALGMCAASAAMKWERVSRLARPVGGSALMLCGIFQLSPWKQSCLRHCRDPMSLAASHAGSGVGGAWKLGLHHGLFCTFCCWGLMVIQLVLGIMSLTAMIVVGLVITLEKLLPVGPWVARAAGAAATIGGIWMLVS